MLRASTRVRGSVSAYIVYINLYNIEISPLYTNEECVVPSKSVQYECELRYSSEKCVFAAYASRSPLG